VHRLQCLAQEAVCRARVTAVQQHEVDQPAMLVDGAEQVLPLSTDLDIGFVHSPGVRTVALIPADALFALRRVTLHPPEDCRGVDLNSALLHHLREIAICDAVLAIPPHATRMISTGNRRHLKMDICWTPRLTSHHTRL